MTPRFARAAFVLLALAACVNLAAGATLALRDPSRAADLLTLYEWCRAWLIDGVPLYTVPAAVTDYPPNAIVLLSPLALVPRAWIVPLWTTVGLALAPMLGYIVVRCVSRGDRADVAVPVLLFLCWASTRTVLQFSVLSLTLAFAAARLADSHRVTSGVALGLALFKPHIAGPVAVWMIVTRRTRAAMVAAAVVVAGWAVFDARVGESPVATLRGYWHVLGEQYGGTDGLIGHTSLRAWTRSLAFDPVAADMWWIAASASLLIVIGWLAARDARRPLECGGIAALSLFCLWSLLAVYHNTNNLILMWPVFVFVWFFGEGATPVRRWAPVVALQAALMYDVPTRLGPRVSPETWMGVAVRDFDRIVVLAGVACATVLWHRVRRTRDAARAARLHT